MIESDKYILNQEKHHKIKIINDVQKRISSFTAEQDTLTLKESWSSEA